MTGYGQGGPLASRAGHDIDYLALSGFLGSNRDPEGRPSLPLTQVADMTGGLLATVGILAALQARERTGRGQVVDASLLEGALALMTLPAARLLAGGSVVNELTGTHACYRVFRCRDGKHLAVGALEPKFWEALCDALDLGDLLGRQWEGGKRREETLGRVAAAFAERDRDEWVRALRALRGLRGAGPGPGRGPRARAGGRAPAGRRAAGGRGRDAHPGLAGATLGSLPPPCAGRRPPSAPTRTRSCARPAIAEPQVARLREGGVVQ